MKLAFITFVLVSLVLSSSLLQTTIAASDSSCCASKCGERCSKAGLKDRCLNYGGICCEECKCASSGNCGNKDECPCCREKMNSTGNPKCPECVCEGFCHAKCGERCLKYCGNCCEECKRVPSGTCGKKDECVGDTTNDGQKLAC